MNTVHGNIVLRDQNNYTSQSNLTIPVIQTAPGADLSICWDGLTKDILCHDVAPATDIDNVSFLQVLNQSQSQIATKLALGQLSAAMVKIYRDHHVDHASNETCTTLSKLVLGSTPVAPATDYVEGADKTYLTLFSKGTTPGSGARSMAFLSPTAGNTNTTVNAPSGCGILSFQADVTTPMPLAAPKNGPYVLDWSQITHDAMGGTVLFQNLDQLMLGYYQGMSAADLQTKFFDIETLATSLYSFSIPQGTKYADLAQAKDANGVAFSGFDRTDGVWAVALLCSSCQVPAPVALAILSPS